MILDEIVAAQKRGEARGITSICSSNARVIERALVLSKELGATPLIEATCNQVNQFGGYTGMTPAGFVTYVQEIARDVGFPFERILLGGDHLGPSAWQNEPAEAALEKSSILIRDYVKAGFTKLHLDCSMRLADDPGGPLDGETSAKRAARLAKIAEETIEASHLPGKLRYIIGSEVPVPGGALAYEDHVSVTKAQDALQTIEVTRRAFLEEGLQDAWDKVVALVVQPGVEFGDDFVFAYQPDQARDLSHFIESQPMIYEAHSTDYQTPEALKALVRDHFAILKVGPALTFAFREAVFALTMIENELFPVSERSNILQVVEAAMLADPRYWEKYYQGPERAQAYKRKYSLSDRIRYYWTQPEVIRSLTTLMKNLANKKLPYALLRQFTCRDDLTAEQVIQMKIDRVLEEYLAATHG